MTGKAKVRIIGAKRGEIATLDDWQKHGQPKGGDDQWKDLRSAKELARAWLPTRESGRLPASVESLLETSPAARGFQAETLFPEHITAVDALPGGQRNHDLVVVGASGGRRVVIAVEGKADEPFGDKTVAQYLTSALGKEKAHADDPKKPRTNAPARIRGLARAVFGKNDDATLLDPAGIGGLPYQLLPALAGTAIEARRHGAETCVFLVHVFVSDQARPGGTRPEKLERNRIDLTRLLELLDVSGDPSKTLVGPILLVGNEHVPADVSIYVGKVSTTLN